MQSTLEVAQIAFFLFGSLALIVGGLVGLRRFVVERPHYSSWEVEQLMGSLRLIRLPSGPAYLHTVNMGVRNQSVAFQNVERWWVRLFPPGDSGWDPTVFRSKATSIKGVTEFFEYEGSQFGTQLAPSNRLMFGVTFEARQILPAVRIYWAVQTRRQRLYLPGFHADSIIANIGTDVVAVDLDDLRYYEQQMGPTDGVGATS